jgi:membrane protein DedA with SNARE-associated domain/membrane-associated phospholipid phosphatase
LQTVDQILSLIGEYGYVVVFLGVLLESAGIPLPGETILIAAGVMVQRGYLDLGDAIVFGILGAAVGDQIGYWVGREGGRPFILRWGRYVKITPERLGRAEGFFSRHGGKAVFLARFVAGLRVFGALVAGISRMRWSTFLFYNVLGGASWATAAVLVGYFLGGSLGLVERWAGRASALLFVLIALTLSLYLVYRWVSNHPEPIRRTAARLEGDRLRRFLRTPLGRWLRRRFSPGEVYGLAFTVGLVVTGLFSWAFGSVVQDILARDPLVRVDRAILYFVYSHGDPGLIAAVTVFEALFSPELLLLAGAAAGILFAVLGYRRGSFRLGFSGVVLLVAVLGTGALAELFKSLFHRERPPVHLQLVPEAGYGFPSSHAVASVAVGAVVWYLFSLRSQEGWGGSWQAKARIGFAVVLVALLVGIGRLYMGAHYLSDVLAGWALGGLWASVCITAAEVFRRLQENGSMGNGRRSARELNPEGVTARTQGDQRPSRPWWRRILRYHPLERYTKLVLDQD